MTSSAIVALLMLTATGVGAQQSALNLQLPPQATATAGDSGDVAGDPPGTYYGDGVSADEDTSTTVVHGGVTTGVGYSREFGTGTSVGADLDVSHVDANGRSMNLHIDVSKSDGFPGQSGYLGQPGYFGGYSGRKN